MNPFQGWTRLEDGDAAPASRVRGTSRPLAARLPPLLKLRFAACKRAAYVNVYGRKYPTTLASVHRRLQAWGERCQALRETPPPPPPLLPCSAAAMPGAAGREQAEGDSESDSDSGWWGAQERQAGVQPGGCHRWVCRSRRASSHACAH